MVKKNTAWVCEKGKAHEIERAQRKEVCGHVVAREGSGLLLSPCLDGGVGTRTDAGTHVPDAAVTHSPLLVLCLFLCS